MPSGVKRGFECKTGLRCRVCSVRRARGLVQGDPSRRQSLSLQSSRAAEQRAAEQQSSRAAEQQSSSRACGALLSSAELC